MTFTHSLATALAAEMLATDLDCLPETSHLRALRTSLACTWSDDEIRSVSPGHWCEAADITAVRDAYTVAARAWRDRLESDALDTETVAL